jgi:aconitate hydratase
MQNNPFNAISKLKTNKGEFTYWSLKALQDQGYAIDKMPFSIRILLENALRNFDNFAITKENVETILDWKPEASDKDILLNLPVF